MSRPRVVVFSPPSNPPLSAMLDEAFGGAPETFDVIHDRLVLRRRLVDADVLVTMDSQLTPELVDHVRAAGIEWVQLASSGFERSLRHRLWRVAQVTHVPSVWAPTVAEHAVALLLALVRQIPRSVGLQSQRDWDRAAGIVGTDSLVGKTVVVVGTGAIGTEIACRLDGFGVVVIGVSRRGGPSTDADPFTRHERSEHLDALIEQADVVVLSLPLTDETSGLMGDAQFASMQPGSYLVNVSRGGIIDQDALVRALDAGRLAGVGLDVVDPEPLGRDDPLWGHDQVLITPHVAGFSGPAGSRRLRDHVLTNIQRWERGEPLLDPIPTG